jgi:hypothetical protein
VHTTYVLAFVYQFQRNLPVQYSHCSQQKVPHLLNTNIDKKFQVIPIEEKGLMKFVIKQ